MDNQSDGLPFGSKVFMFFLSIFVAGIMGVSSFGVWGFIGGPVFGAVVGYFIFLKPALKERSELKRKAGDNPVVSDPAIKARAVSATAADTVKMTIFNILMLIWVLSLIPAILLAIYGIGLMDQGNYLLGALSIGYFGGTILIAMAAVILLSKYAGKNNEPSSPHEAEGIVRRCTGLGGGGGTMVYRICVYVDSIGEVFIVYMHAGVNKPFQKWERVKVLYEKFVDLKKCKIEKLQIIE